MAQLLLRTLSHLTSLNPGYDGRNVLTANLSMQDALRNGCGYQSLADASLQSIRQYPGVEAAGIALSLPYERALNDGVRVLDGPVRMDRNEISNVTYVTPGYFEAMRFRLLRGRF